MIMRFFGPLPWQALTCYRYKHLRRGTSYIEVGRGRLQTGESLPDMAELVAYRNEETGEWWFRPVTEFDDPDRFIYAGEVR